MRNNWVKRLALEVVKLQKDWPSWLREPRPGTDYGWEIVATGKDPSYAHPRTEVQE